ncbi:response regulator [Candidatus Woesearchaeota archaeon]|jgi:CheY-like chemotaxis protein|nr:response regulator [Candidatus Woesearchaeota archaeon]
MAVQDGKHVLIVDDDATNLSLANDVLESSGYSTHPTLDPLFGLQAIQANLDRGTTIDLVLSDYEMPGINGVELSRRMAQTPAYKNIPVILYSGRTQEEITQREGGVLPENIQHFIHKPYNIQDLVDAVRSTIESHPVPR